MKNDTQAFSVEIKTTSCRLIKLQAGQKHVWWKPDIEANKKEIVWMS